MRMYCKPQLFCLQTSTWVLCLIALHFHFCSSDSVGSGRRRHQIVSRSGRRAHQQESHPTRFDRPQYPTVTEVLKVWSPTDYRVAYINDLVEQSFATTFYDYRIENFSRFVAVPKQSVIYAVGDGVKLVKLDVTSLLLLDMYSLPPVANINNVCQDDRSCQQARDISLLALMPNREMIWFCYAHYLHRNHRLLRFVESGCMVPTFGSLTESLLQWENPQFSSLDPGQPTITFNAADGFTYVAALTPNHVQLLRARMPDWNGKLDWSGTLTLDKRRNIITEPAEVLLIFETEAAVYFVLREQTLQRPVDETTGRSDPRFGLTYIDVSCLVRVCKGDTGGPPSFNADKFSTVAKADLRCQAADDSGQRFAFTYLTAAYWDVDRQQLFATFTTEKLAPVGSALCIYSKASIEAVFSGPVVSPTVSGLPLDDQQPSPLPNEFPNICERFNSKNVTSEELSLGRRLSSSFPTRFGAIEPIYHRALLTQSGQVWRQIAVHPLPDLPVHRNLGQSAGVVIVWLASDSTVLRLAVYEPGGNPPTESKATGPSVCKLSELRLGSNWQVLRRLHVPPERSADERTGHRFSQTSASNVTSNWWPVENSQAEVDIEVIRQIEIIQNQLIVMTSRQIIRLPLTDCSVYPTYEDCMQSKDPHCGWSWPDGRCRDGYADAKEFGRRARTNDTSWQHTFSPSVDRSKAMLESGTVCPSDRHPLNTREKAWSDWYTCRWYTALDSRPGPVDQAVGEEFEAKKTSISRSVGRCRCRMCLSRTECRLGSQEVINCTSSDRNWLPWSGWSRCDLETGVQIRHRLCRPRATCVGSNREQRLCDPSSTWSDYQEEISAEAIAASSSHRLRRVDNRNRMLRSPEDYFTLNHMLLVALFCLVIGCLMTTVILFAYWQCCSVSPSLLFCRTHYANQTLPPNMHLGSRACNSLTVHATNEADQTNSIHTDGNRWASDIASESSRHPLIDPGSGRLKNLSPEPVSGRSNVHSIYTGRSKSTSFSGPPTASTVLNFTFDATDTEVPLTEPASPLYLTDNNARQPTVQSPNPAGDALAQAPAALSCG